VQGFRARIAKVTEYSRGELETRLENNRECFHCVQCHPQYVKANFDAYEEAYASVATGRRWQPPSRAGQMGGQGIAIIQRRSHPVPDPDRNMVRRQPHRAGRGFETESMDGQRVAPLMGEYQDSDVGVLRMRSMPNFWVHGSCDHAVAARLLPAGPRRTIVRGYWLVDQDAREGDDYQLERLLPFWNLTNEQDWEICKWQQKGIDSIGYEPGPLSHRKEYNVDAFIRWYLQQMRTRGRSGSGSNPLSRVA
jgi:Rieske 2Fe-2S family protein